MAYLSRFLGSCVWRKDICPGVLWKFTIFLVSLLLLGGCASGKDAPVAPEEIGKLYGFETVFVEGGGFLITTYQKVHDKKAPYVFYIEGDGAAFTYRHMVSTNPTPRARVFIELAAMDKRQNVVYVARPCQYTPMDLNPKCEKSYWTEKRLSDDSIEALNEVINKVNNGQKFSLVGYSGGGGVAVLIAARNPMVRDIVTIAGNLDIAAFTAYHKTPPMKESLNPVDYAKLIKDIPQFHTSGEKDRIVPPSIAIKYVKESDSPCVRQQTFKGVTHKNGWNKIWAESYNIPIRCER